MIVVRQDIKFNEEKAMKLSLEMKLDLHAKEEILVPKNEPQDVEQPHAEDHGGSETTQVDKFQEKWAEGKLYLQV